MATILIVDDRPSNRQFLLTLLGYSEHRLLEAANGAEALKLIRSARPDLVITDILMPTMDGYEMVNRMRADRQIAATPVIFYTATYSEPQANLLAAACGVHTVLPKPSNPERILAAVSQVLNPGAEAASTAASGPARGAKSAKPVDIALSAYLRDLQGVKDEFEGIARRGATLKSERERATDLSMGFAASVARLQRITSRLSALIEVGFAMTSERDPERLVNLFFAAACDMIESRVAAVGVLDEQESTLRHVAAKGLDPDVLRRGGNLYAGLLGSLLLQRGTIRRRIGAAEAEAAAGSQLPPGHILAMSIASPERIYGWICFADRVGAAEFSEEDERLAGIMATELALRYEHAMLFEVVQRHAASLQLEISERRRAQEALQESEGRFRQLAESIREVFWLTDTSKNEMLYVSPAYEEIWGRSVQAIYHRPHDWLEAIHPYDRARVREAARTKQARGDYDEEYRIIRPDGSIRWIRDRAFPVSGERGKVLRVAGVAEDITERRRATDALRESERRFSDMLRNVGLVSLMLDRDARITYCNDYLLRLTGWTREEVVGKDWFERFLPAEAADQVKEVFAALLADVPAAWHHENEILTRAGDRRLIRWSNTVLRSPTGEVIGTASIGEDATERTLQARKIGRLTRMYAVLSGINATIVRVNNREHLFRECCRIAVEAGQFALACARVIGSQQQGLEPAAAAAADAGLLERVKSALSPLDRGRGPGAIAVREKRAIFVNDIDADARIERPQAYRDLGIRSIAALPLLVDKDPVGVLELHSTDAGYFDEEEVRLLLELAGDISFALEHIKRAEKLEYLALFDSLTGLANRALFLDRLAQRLHLAGPAGEKVAVVLSDVERLTTINESLGRYAGDALLKQLAERLAHQASREELGRVGADHFAIVLPAITSEQDVAPRVERLWQEWLGKPFAINGAELHVAAKAGIALYPKDGSDAETLLRHAEVALRRAKETGERHLFHVPEMTDRTAEKLSFENSLRRALEKNEFVLHYQPKLDLATRRIVGAEALLRWQSPDHGLVPPGRFIRLLEETGLILEVGAWALRRAMLDQRRLCGQSAAPLRIAVNVSPVQLRRRDFVEVVKEAISQGQAPTCLDLEVTESVIMDDVAGNTQKLKAVRDLGVNIAIDDFGTGYSCLSYLTRLPVHALKIDRSFIVGMVNEPDTMTLVSTIVSLAHSLRLTVVAEGVETEEQAKIMQLLRCEQAQGYLFGKPVPPEEFAASMRVDG